MSQQFFSEKDVGKIVRRAAELQEKSTGSTAYTPGVSREELERVAREMGIDVGGFDRIAYGLCAAVIAVRLGAYKLAARLPLMADAADRRLVATIERQLASYGHAHFATDASAYRPAAKPEEAVGR